MATLVNFHEKGISNASLESSLPPIAMKRRANSMQTTTSAGAGGQQAAITWLQRAIALQLAPDEGHGERSEGRRCTATMPMRAPTSLGFWIIDAALTLTRALETVGIHLLSIPLSSPLRRASSRVVRGHRRGGCLSSLRRSTKAGCRPAWRVVVSVMRLRRW